MITPAITSNVDAPPIAAMSRTVAKHMRDAAAAFARNRCEARHVARHMSPRHHPASE